MFQVTCSEGFDGGLPQEFVAEVYMMGHKNLFAYVNVKWEFTKPNVMFEALFN